MKGTHQQPGEGPLSEGQFVEEVGLFFEEGGLPRMAGRILGWLLICDPPQQSLDELVQRLAASKGSVSTMTRLLMKLGLIGKTSVPGERRAYFRVNPDAWYRLSKDHLKRISAFRKLTERGLSLLEGEDPELRQRLVEARDLHAFFERELPALMDRWEAERASEPLEEGA